MSRNRTMLLTAALVVIVVYIAATISPARAIPVIQVASEVVPVCAMDERVADLINNEKRTIVAILPAVSRLEEKVPFPDCGSGPPAEGFGSVITSVRIVHSGL